MCGIAGIVANSPQPREKLVSHLQCMNAAQAHRGPDDEGIWIDNSLRFGLGHRRLSILDLSNAGHQPMLDEQTQSVISFNGEIYNYLELARELSKNNVRLYSNSDTELLLKAYRVWGINVLYKLNGMFAFAIIDQQKQKLYLARDRLGIKPLYYVYRSNKLAFASEIKPLLTLDWVATNPDMATMIDFLEHGPSLNITDHHTFFQHIKRLLPAQLMEVDLDNVFYNVSRYWQIPISDRPISFRNFDDSLEKFRALFTRAIQLQQRSDVPIGVCLSGGLDSSSIAASLRTSQVHTFSVYFPGKDFDESPHFNTVAKYLHTKHHVTYPILEDPIATINRILFTLEEPTNHFGVIPQWHVIALATNKVKVLLNGQGGDELLAGYTMYFNAYAAELRAKSRANPLLAFWALSELFKLKRNFSAPNIKNTFLFPKSSKHLPSYNPCLVSNDLYRKYSRCNTQHFATNTGLLNALYAHTTQTSLPSLLHDEDKISMAHSIENRVPFLDHHLVEFVFKLDSAHKLYNGWTKYLLRQAIRNRLPQNIVWRRDKKGYATPLQLWLNDHQHALYQLLRQIADAPREWLNSAGLQRQIANHRQAPSAYSSRILWRVVAVELWFQQFFSKIR